MSTRDGDRTLRAAAVNSTAAALRVLVQAARREQTRQGHVSQETWDAIDGMLDSMIEQLPRPRRRYF